jgi:hypothetical protein
MMHDADSRLNPCKSHTLVDSSDYEVACDRCAGIYGHDPIVKTHLIIGGITDSYSSMSMALVVQNKLVTFNVIHYIL